MEFGMVHGKVCGIMYGMVWYSMLLWMVDSIIILYYYYKPIYYVLYYRPW